MNDFYAEILRQPDTLRKLIAFYDRGEGSTFLEALPVPDVPVLTGMGASFHAAWVTALKLHSLGIPAILVEAADLVHYGASLLRRRSPIVFVSQSGASAEVAPVIESLPQATILIAVTNDPESPLSQRARVTLPLLVDRETTVASQTYLNSLAVLWLLTRRWGGAFDGTETEALLTVAAEIERLLLQANAISGQWIDVLGGAGTLLFTGHGPHAATARQAAMMASEWAKVAARSVSTAAFRHGFIEIAGPGLGVVVFAAPGRSYKSAHVLAVELGEYGADVLLVENGHAKEIRGGENGRLLLDEFLSPMLDVIPAQLFAEALARRLAIAPGFRHISKVVTQL